MKLLDAGISDVSDDEKNLSDHLNEDEEQDYITPEENGSVFQACNSEFCQEKHLLRETMKIHGSCTKRRFLDNDFLYN